MQKLIVNEDGTQKYVDVEDIVVEEQTISNAFKIDHLKQQLTDTDYKIIKCYEYQLAGLQLPYDIQVLHAERQALRDQINALEG